MRAYTRMYVCNCCTADTAVNYLLKYLWDCISSIIEVIFIAIFKAICYGLYI